MSLVPTRPDKYGFHRPDVLHEIPGGLGYGDLVYDPAVSEALKRVAELIAGIAESVNRAAELPKLNDRPQTNLGPVRIADDQFADLRELLAKVSAAKAPQTQYIGGGFGGTHLQDIKRGITDMEQRLDYGSRTDGQPVYVGKAVSATATSVAQWQVQRLTYNGSDLLTRVQVIHNAVWDDRSMLAWT